MIADLTHDNNGAYWEARFAEGLGRPVIYTCRKQKWDATKSHFDTSHLNTIIWDPEKFGRCRHALVRDDSGNPARRGEDDGLINQRPFNIEASLTAA